ncbi:MAG: phenylalanine--tRNA ligase subunit alpha [Chloroflexi bacterium HGW-Chloroflexi-5]|jgi:phenylalanyl-tRNA synthetase alpha chain|nr:MAG: phenylalanine--tRNA ligase subunit alpha [Chloroflexi bacterium HGW-Chloroflexi-5]
MDSIEDIKRRIEEDKEKALASLSNVVDAGTASQWKNQFLGSGSAVGEIMQNMRNYSADVKPYVGSFSNETKQFYMASIEAKISSINEVTLAASIASEKLDVTLPGRPMTPGRLHPDTQMLRELYRVFGEMGFQVYRSREVETDEYNFQLLNFPVGHPARDMQDTYFVEAGERGDNPIVMRTHTSPGQVRSMREYAATNPENPPAIRLVLPGMCYRYEQTDARHETQFDQIEGIAVGEGITFSNLKATLSDLARRLFGQNVRTRFRASYFPFTEPSAEFDVECFLCGGKGCAVCGGGWLEIGGCGMVNPNVLRNGGYDPERYSGFAFGLGPQRIAMLRYGINDIRYFWENDLRFLEQF